MPKNQSSQELMNDGAARIVGGAAPLSSAPVEGAGSIAWLPAMGGAGTGNLRAIAQEHGRRGDLAMRQGRFREAMQDFKRAVEADPDTPNYHFSLALAGWQGGEPDIVEPQLREVIRLAPNHFRGYEALGQWFGELGLLDEAVRYTQQARDMAPNEHTVRVSHAYILHLTAQPQAAWEAIEPIVSAGTTDVRVLSLFARLAPGLKQEQRALEAIEGLFRSSATDADRPPLHYAAAGLLDRIGRYDEAFEHARHANNALHGGFDPNHFKRQIDRRLSYFTPQRLHDLPRASQSSRRPVFIIGMARSGTSLAEQILACHPQVHGGGEMRNLSLVADAAAKAGWTEGEIYPEYLDVVSVRRLNRLANEYLSAIGKLNATATYITDKMPHNFLYLGLIALLFPDCHIIHCVRNPLDVCLSCYMTDFGIGHYYSHDLKHLGTFYNDYKRCMEHWKTVVNLPMLEVRYEDVVADLEGQARRMLEFLDLPWDEGCLKFHESKRPVATASKDQVRRPLYKSSMGRWKHYEKHLGPLIELVGRPGEPAQG